MLVRSPAGRLLIVVALLVTAGCAKARNYTNPLGPIMGPVTVAPAAPAPSAELRVVTFNIKFGHHMDRAIDLLSRPGPLQGADILVVQELDGAAVELLARALGMNHAYVPSAVHPASRRDFGVAILSPWPVTDVRKVPLPHQHRFRKLSRAAVAATVHTSFGPVRVYGVHLESPLALSSGKRRQQAQAVLADGRDWKGAVVVAGDLNGRGPAGEIADAGFEWLTRNVHNTLLLLDADHVLARGLCPALEKAAAKEEDATGASDHSPVWAVLRPCTSGS